MNFDLKGELMKAKESLKKAEEQHIQLQQQAQQAVGQSYENLVRQHGVVTYLEKLLEDKADPAVSSDEILETVEAGEAF